MPQRSDTRYPDWFPSHHESVRAPRPTRDAKPGENIAVAETTLRGGKAGKAHINRCLRGSEAKWGMYRNKHAVVLQIEIDARLEYGAKLNELCLDLALLQDDPNQAKNPQRPEEQATGTLLILEHPSPTPLKGETESVHITRAYTLSPQVEALGVSASVGSRSSSRVQDLNRAPWHFRSYWSNDPLSRKYTTAQWRLTATADNPEFEDLGLLYAGLVLQHPKQLFYISCKASGKLTKRFHHFKSRGRDERPYYTCLTPEDSKEQIEQHVRALDSVLGRLMHSAAPSK